MTAILNIGSLHPYYGVRRDYADFSPRIEFEPAYKLRPPSQRKTAPNVDAVGLCRTACDRNDNPADGAFGARIRLSNCLGLLTVDDLAMLVLIKDIRNRFRRKKRGFPR